MLAPSLLFSPKNNAHNISYSQHGAGALPLDPEVRGVICELNIVAGVLGSHPWGVDLEGYLETLSVGVVDLSQGERGPGQVSWLASVRGFL